jgi:phosphoglycolate phosphatase
MILVGVIVILAYAITQFGQIIPPLLVAIILSYILNPFVEFFEVRLRLPRSGAVILIYLLLIVLLLLAPAILVPVAFQAAQKIDLDLQQLAENIADFLAQPVVILNYSIDLLTLYNELLASAQDFFSPVAAQTVSLLFDVAEAFVWIIFTLVISFYLLKDVDAIVMAMDRLVPPDHLDEFRKLRREINDIWHGFFRAQLIQCLVIGTIVGVVMAVAGVQDALVLALVAVLFEVAPTVGHTLSGAVGVLFAFFQGPSYHQMPNPLFAMLVAVLYLFISQIDTNYILPRILGRRVHLHPLVVIVGLIAGAKLGGVLGVFLVTPILGTLRVLGRYLHRKLLDVEPFPEPAPPYRAITPTPYVADGPRWTPARQIEAVLFDLDGTLIDTDDRQTEALARRLEIISRLLPNRDPAQAARRVILKAEGPISRVLTLLDTAGMDDNFFALVDRLRRFKGERPIHNLQMVPGAKTALRALEGRYRLGIVTTRGQREAEAFLVQFQLADLFEVVITHESTPRLKPHPEPVRYAAEVLSLSPERCVMVGDTTVDVAAAKKAGVWAIGVLCGFGEWEELKEAGADLILESPAELIQWLAPAPTGQQAT